MPLTFELLRDRNHARCAHLKDAHGRPTHARGVLSWTKAEWFMAAAGELGELGNLLKKELRGDFEPLFDHEHMRAVSGELADVVIYLDLLAARCGISLEAAVLAKFNRKSAELRLPYYLHNGDVTAPGRRVYEVFFPPRAKGDADTRLLFERRPGLPLDLAPWTDHPGVNAALRSEVWDAINIIEEGREGEIVMPAEVVITTNEIYAALGRGLETLVARSMRPWVGD